MINKKILIAIALISCVAVSLFVAIRQTQAATDAIVWMEPIDGVYVSPCTNFVVDVWIDVNDPAIADYDFFLNYNPFLMDPVNAWDGGFLQPPVIFNWEVLPDYFIPGYDAVHVWAASLSAGSLGQGILASVEFHCDGVGVDNIDLMDVWLSDDIGGYHAPAITNWIVTVDQNIPPATAWIDPADFTVPICVPFPVNVMVDIPMGYDLYSFQLVLTYDTAFVDAIDIVPGDFPPLPRTVDYKLIDDIIGYIAFDVTSYAVGGGSTGSGSIAKVTFHCTGAGESILTISSLDLYTSQGWHMPYVGADGRVIQKSYWEPLKLQHLVELPYSYHMTDLPFVPPSTPEGYLEVKAEIEAKGYVFDPAVGGSLYHIDSFFDVYFEPGSEPFNGTVTSWWSSDTLEDGTRACMLSAEMSDGSGMAVGFVTNLMPPDQIPEVDPYIIYNAEPYFFIDFYWWAWTPVGKVVHFYYWWHNSHNHPNWFWGPYWWWRTTVKSYYYPYTIVPYWRPWWSWWWHWVYYRHWYWWSSYFPYDP